MNGAEANGAEANGSAARPAETCASSLDVSALAEALSPWSSFSKPPTPREMEMLSSRGGRLIERAARSWKALLGRRNK